MSQQEIRGMRDLLIQLFSGLSTLFKGGPMLVPLLFMSLAATAIVLDRLAALRREQRIPAEYIARIYRLLERGKYDVAIALCDNRPLLVTDMLRVGIQNRDMDDQELMVELKRHLRLRGRVIYRNMSMLGVVASVAPLLGLLGTVIGMLMSFSALSTGASAEQLKIVANGISIALLTTFAGLVVAVPTYIAYRYLVHRADQLMREMQRYGVSLVRFLQAEELYHPHRAADDGASNEFDIEWETEVGTETG